MATATATATTLPFSAAMRPSLKPPASDSGTQSSGGPCVNLSRIAPTSVGNVGAVWLLSMAWKSRSLTSSGTTRGRLSSSATTMSARGRSQRRTLGHATNFLASSMTAQSCSLGPALCVALSACATIRAWRRLTPLTCARPINRRLPCLRSFCSAVPSRGGRLILARTVTRARTPRIVLGASRACRRSQSRGRSPARVTHSLVTISMRRSACARGIAVMKRHTLSDRWTTMVSVAPVAPLALLDSPVGQGKRTATRLQPAGSEHAVRRPQARPGRAVSTQATASASQTPRRSPA